MPKTLSLLGWRAAFLAMALACASSAAAQGTPASKDDALDGLLKKLEEKEKAKEKPTPDGKKPGQGGVETKDKDLDSLLEKLGSSPDRAAPDEKKPGGGMPQKPQPGEKSDKDKDKDGKSDPNALTGKSQKLDEHLEELTGKRKKKNRRDQEQESGPLSDVVKEMRDVEERLGKPDTGEETRKKQTQIVKRIETLIEQARSSQSQSQSSKQRKITMKPGEQQGQQQGEQPGATGGVAPNSKPIKPNEKRSMAGGKDAWGHLPPELRQELENVFKEEPLPEYEDLIRKYYLSVSKKSTSRGN